MNEEGIVMLKVLYQGTTSPGSPSTRGPQRTIFVRWGWKPVKRGLVASPGQYRWSSFNHYTTGIRGVVEIESEGTARLRGPLIAIKPR